MSLPTTVALRRIAGRATYDNGALVLTGRVEVTAVPPELRYHPSGTVATTIHTRPYNAYVVDGYWSLDAGVIPWDAPDVDAGVTGQWSYRIHRSWAPLRDKYVVVGKGTLGTTADDPLDVSDLMLPEPVGSAALVRDGLNTAQVQALVGVTVRSVTVSGSTLTVTNTDGTTASYTLATSGGGTPAPTGSYPGATTYPSATLYPAGV